MNNFDPGSSSAARANCTPRRNSAAGLDSKSSSVGFQSTSTPCSTPNGVSSNSICMSMIWVTPARATLAILSDVQIPPPTAIRSVNHVISILFLRGAGNPARPNTSRAAVRPLFKPLIGEPRCPGTPRGEIESEGCRRITFLSTVCLILEYPRFRLPTVRTQTLSLLRPLHRHHPTRVPSARLLLSAGPPRCLGYSPIPSQPESEASPARHRSARLQVPKVFPAGSATSAPAFLLLPVYPGCARWPMDKPHSARIST